VSQQMMRHSWSCLAKGLQAQAAASATGDRQETYTFQTSDQTIGSREGRCKAWNGNPARRWSRRSSEKTALFIPELHRRSGQSADGRLMWASLFPG